MACVVALLHDAGGRQASCDAGAFDSHGWTLKGKAAKEKLKNLEDRIEFM